MRVLILGSSGQLGKSLCAELESSKIIYAAFSHAELDITNPLFLERAINDFLPSVVINAAAYTDVDNAENYEDLAYSVNACGPKNIARICNQLDITLIHISTDYVFDGNQEIPYRPSDLVCPDSVYGKTKLAGEEHIKNTCNKYLIIRTSWLFSQYAGNFLTTMINLAYKKRSISVVSDQIGNPTNALHLSRAIVCALIKIESSRFTSGIYHYGDRENCTWHEFAEYIFEVMFNNNQLTGPLNVKAILSSEYHSLVTRPKYSAIDSTDFCEQFDSPHFSWKEDLSETINRYIASSKQ